jgi:2,3-bisphosphoglycerate-dependent phosphoglycerate mutase
MTQKLLVVRHGNTFNQGEVPTRVGARTDLELVQSGIDQAKLLGKALIKLNLLPNQVIASKLMRSRSTAEIALEVAGINKEIIIYDSNFDEIDYGPDENKTEEEVVSRIGSKAIEEWNQNGTVPPGWKVNIDSIKQNWFKLANKICESSETCVCMVVTSNGIARFSPVITGDFTSFSKRYDIKISTGAFCEFEYINGHWLINRWNIRPKDIL